MEKARIYFIDNLRILLITLVILVHLSITYGGAGGWYYRDGEPDQISGIVLTLHNGVNQSFFMGFLFLISGYFTPGSYDRKGAWGFMKDRLLRLGIPMLCYDLVVEPLLAYPLIKVGAWENSGTYCDFLAEYFSRINLGRGPLWFLETLLIFAAFYVLWRRRTGAIMPDRQTTAAMFSNRAVVRIALALGVIIFIVRIWLPVGWAFRPMNLQFPFFPQYICLFVIGIIAHRRNWLERIPDAMGKLWSRVALIWIVILLPALFVLGGALSGDIDPYAGGFHWQCLAYALWEQSLCMAMIITLLVMFGKRFNRQGKLAKATSSSAYAAYIIHAPFLVLFTLAIRNIALYPLLKFALAALICVPSCFALGHVIRKLPLREGSCKERDDPSAGRQSGLRCLRPAGR
jgi:fucose 4-O-acetylase-like acetyltransferase